MGTVVFYFLLVSVALAQCLRLADKMAPAPAPLQQARAPVLSWIQQKLDHFNASDERTWPQRYFVNEQFYSPGGPIFLMISLEGPADADWLRGGQMTEYALFFNAKIFLVEQRFYGESRPTEDTSVENLQYLTAEQSLADVAHLVRAIGVSHPDAKVVVFGGSIAGNLAAWARLKYPDVIDAAVVASAPLLARFNFMEYFQEVGSVMALADQDCYDDMKEAVTDLDAVMRGPGGAQTVTQMFGLCTDLDPDNMMDMMTFFTTFADIYAGVVQTASSLAQVLNNCALMTNPVYGATPLDRLVDLFRRVFRPDPDTCFEITYAPYMEAYGNTSWESPINSRGQRVYTYQTCSWFADFETSESQEQPFGDAFPSAAFVRMCTDFYGESFDADYIQAAVERLNDNYGGLFPAVTDVVFTQGSFDPWRVIGVQQDISESATAIVIEESSHIAFLYATNANDSPQLTAARLQVRDLIGSWI